MNSDQKLNQLREFVLAKREYQEAKKDLSDIIKKNGEVIDNTIMDSGDIDACRELLLNNIDLMTKRQELSKRIKGIDSQMAELILGEGVYEGQADIFDMIDGDEEKEAV